MLKATPFDGVLRLVAAIGDAATFGCGAQAEGSIDKVANNIDAAILGSIMISFPNSGGRHGRDLVLCSRVGGDVLVQDMRLNEGDTNVTGSCWVPGW